MKISRGFHSSVENRVARVHAAKTSLPFRGAIFSRVLTGEGDSERVKVESVAGTKVSAFSYPFASQSAWIRGQPEATTTMISIIGGDTFDIQPIGYFDPAKSGAASTYRNIASATRQNPGEPVASGILPYRSLAPGEVDMASLFAQTFMGRQDVHQSRGGLSHFTMHSLESRHETPLFTVKGHAHQLGSAGGLVDELRYGTVRRTVSNKSNATQQSLVRGVGLNTRDATAPLFAKEFSVLVDWLGDPNKLIDHRQGIVVDDDGNFGTSIQTAKNLRARFQWHSSGGFTYGEIDEAGNTLFETSEDASEGYVMNVPSGDIKIKVGGASGLGGGSGGKFQLQTTNEINLASDRKSSWVSKEGFNIQTPQRGEIKAQRSLGLKSDGNINIETPTMLGVKVGNPNRDRYPVLIAQPDYLSTLNNYYSSQTSLAGALAAYGGNAAGAWAAVGPLLMLLDPSGTVMGLCLSAGQSAGQVAANAPQVSTAVAQHLPRLAQMPSGFISSKILSE